MLPTALAIAIAVQYAVDYQTFVVFLYMYVRISRPAGSAANTYYRLCNSKVPAVMFMGMSLWFQSDAVEVFPSLTLHKLF